MMLNIIFIFINRLFFPRYSLALSIMSRGLRIGGERREMKNKMRLQNVNREIKWGEQKKG